MYGAVPLRTIKQALLDLKAEGRLDRVKMLDLTNCTFDGHIYNTRRVMEECLAIKPDLIFLWDEAWFGFARFSPFLRPRTAMGAAQRDRGVDARSRNRSRRTRSSRPNSARTSIRTSVLLETRLIPDPRKIRLRVYQTNSTHKSMSALRQGSMVLGQGRRIPHRRAAVQGGGLHPCLDQSEPAAHRQSLDVARRQMELEGYGLVMPMRSRSRSPFAARSTRNPLISKYFQVLGADAMVPARIPQQRLQGLPGRRARTGRTALKSLRRRRVLPRSDPHDAGVRHGRIRRHAVQGHAGRTSTTSRSTRPRATGFCCSPTSTTRAATSRT